MIKFKFLLLPLIMLFSSCEEPTPPAEEPKLLSFSITQEYNESIFEDVIFQDIDYQVFSHTFKSPVNLTSLRATFTASEGAIVTVNGVEQKSGLSYNDFSSPVEYLVTNADGISTTYTVTLNSEQTAFTSLPIIYINTENSMPIVDKENWILADLSILGKDNNYLVEGLVTEIRGRGNTTWHNPKKPYAIKLDKKNEFFGMPKHKRWVLLAAYNDKSMIRTDLAFYLAEEFSNLRWKQSGELVELVLNGKFLGNYYLCEHIKIDENRVSDGYVIEIDVRAKEANGDIFFTAKNSGLKYVIKDPDVIKGSTEFKYVEDYINKLESDLKNFDVESYSQYIDMESMVDWYLNSELTKNPDAAFFISVYMNLSDDGKLYMGPLWDYDLSFGNQIYDDGEGSDNGYKGFTIRDGDRSKIWLKAMFANEEFVTLLKQKMRVVADNEAQIMAYIDVKHRELTTSALCNDRMWGLLTPKGTSSAKIIEAYDKEIKSLKDWLHGRIGWLSTNIEAL